jgi:hypothetical protein
MTARQLLSHGHDTQTDIRTGERHCRFFRAAVFIGLLICCAPLLAQNVVHPATGASRPHKSTNMPLRYRMNTARSRFGTEQQEPAPQPTGEAVLSHAVGSTGSEAVTQGGLPNLTPYQPAGWSDFVVLTTSPGSTTDASVIRSTETVYLSFAVINNGGSPTADRFYTAIELDGVTVQLFYTDPPLNAGDYVVGQDYNLGVLSPGVHTVRVVADSTGAIAEDNESDNVYTKTFSVIAVPVESWLYAVDDGSDDGSSTLFRMGTSPVSGEVGLQVVGETGVQGIFDITFVGDRLIGVASGSFSGVAGDIFVEINPDTGTAQTIGTIQAFGTFNALETEGPDTFVAATSEGEFWRIKLSSFSATRVGAYGNGLQSSGDLALDSDGTLYGTTNGFFSDTLVRVDRNTGQATSIGSLGYGAAYGLAVRPDTGTLLGVVDADSEPLLVSIDKSSGQATLIGSIPAPAGLAGLAVRGTVTTPAQISASNLDFGNTTRVGNAIDVWLDVTIDGSPATDPSGYALRIVASNGSTALTTSAIPQSIGGSRWHAGATILPNPLSGTSCSGKICFEGGQVQIYRPAAPGTSYTIPNLTVNAYGTTFDMSKHAYRFANGAWGTPGLSWFTDPYFRAGDTVATYVTPAKRDTFWKSVGEYQFLFLILARQSEGLCYGMANSSIASYTHRAQTSFWADRDTNGGQCNAATYCYFNTAADNSWQRGIDARWLVSPPGLAPGAPDNPYASEDIYDTTYSNGAWTLTASKKILYYFLTQTYFTAADSREWPGQDKEGGFDTVASGSNAAVNSGLTDLLRNGNPVSLSLMLEPTDQLPEGGGHEIVGAELIQWGATASNLTSELMTYDNNLPLPVSTANSYAPFERILFNSAMQGLTLDRVRLADGSPSSWPGLEMLLTKLKFLTTTGDSEHIYQMPFSSGAHATASRQEMWSLPPPDPNADAVSADSIADTGYLKIIAVGVDSFKVYAGTTNTELTMKQNGALDGTQAVYVHANGDLVAEIYLPIMNDKLYRVEMIKSPSLSRLKIFTSVPTDAVTLDKRGYENIEMSATDPTKAILYIGTTNTNHAVTRISASNVQDQVGSTFAVTVPISPAKRRAVKH